MKTQKNPTRGSGEPGSRSAVLSAAVLCLLMPLCTVAAAQSPGTAATGLRVPDGLSVLFSAHAKGFQIYGSKAKADDPTKFEWILQGPEAELFDSFGKHIGDHSAGPEWDDDDGSSLTGHLVATAPSQSPFNVPWALIETRSIGNRGVMSSATYVMRVDTKGGVPQDQPSAAGQTTRTAYEATYLFLSPVAVAKKQEVFSGSFQSLSGSGIFASALGSTGNNFGLYGQSASNSGRGVYGNAASSTGFAFGGEFESMSTDGIGVLGKANSVTGVTFGGNFQSLSPQGVGVYGVDMSHTGRNYGVYGQSDSISGVGVTGVTFSSQGPAIGVLGMTGSFKDGYGVFSEGNLGANGVICVRMHDPAKPEGFLRHYAAQGPEPQNIYNGTVTTDLDGEAWVGLPPYFEQINKDFRYQLTVVDGKDDDSFVQAKIARLIEGNRFKIRTSAPSVKVCWEVKGVRNDAFVRDFAPAALLSMKEFPGRR